MRDLAMKPIKSILTGVALTAAVATQSLAAGVELNASSTGLALQWYDPVAYFIVGEATPGNWTITSSYNDATYRFASEEHKAAFDADPEAYLPQYGGYCAWAVAQGKTAKGDARRWAVVDGKLYLNYNKGIQKKWDKDRAGFIASADQNWPTVLQD